MNDLATWFWLGFFFGYVPLAAFAGVYASARGRSGGGYFLLALLVSPLIVILIVALLDPLVVGEPRRRYTDEALQHCRFN